MGGGGLASGRNRNASKLGSQPQRVAAGKQINSTRKQASRGQTAARATCAPIGGARGRANHNGHRLRRGPLTRGAWGRLRGLGGSGMDLGRGGDIYILRELCVRWF